MTDQQFSDDAVETMLHFMESTGWDFSDSRSVSIMMNALEEEGFDGDFWELHDHCTALLDDG